MTAAPRPAEDPRIGAVLRLADELTALVDQTFQELGPGEPGMVAIAAALNMTISRAERAHHPLFGAFLRATLAGQLS